jgi:peptidylprolyl isomerase
VPLLALAVACGSGSSGGGKSGGLPSVTGSFGTKPTITFPSGDPDKTLQKSVLKPGTGRTVATGDLLVVNYLGQIWHGNVFDNSYDRHTPAGFPIGVGQVIPGWDQTLVGAQIGSRLLLVIPPDKGYGTSGNTQAGIKGTDTLAFVVDVVAAYAAKTGGDAHAAPQHVAAGLPKVGGKLGAAPTLKVPRGTKMPKKTQTIVLDRGTGQPVQKGLIVLQYVAVDWTGKSIGSTWAQGSGSPAAVPIGDPAQATPFDGLVGLPIGSRVLVEIPAKAASAGAAASPADAVVVDIVAQPPTT